MTDKDFFDLVKRMREKQKEYFKNRAYNVMKESMQLEKEVDQAILEIENRGKPEIAPEQNELPF